MAMDVSILIVSYNTADLTLQCLASIFDKTRDISFEVIVIDNASTDSSVERISSEFPQVKLLAEKHNLGFGKANNIGAKQADGNYLFLLNSDTILLENSIKVLKYYLDICNDPAIAVVGCKLLDIHQQPHISYGNFPSLTQEVFEYGLSKVFRRYYKERLSPSVIDNSNQIKEVDYLMGADMFFKRSVFEKVGGFDEDFFLYYEETELCFRLKKLGYKIIWNPATEIVHYLGASGKKEESINYWTLEQLIRSKLIYYKKCEGNLKAAIVKYLVIPKALIKYRKFDVSRIFKLLLKAESNH